MHEEQARDVINSPSLIFYCSFALLFRIIRILSYWQCLGPVFLHISLYICCCFFLQRKLSLQSLSCRLASPSHLNLKAISFGPFRDPSILGQFSFSWTPIYLILSPKTQYQLQDHKTATKKTSPFDYASFCDCLAHLHPGLIVPLC